ncbi:hypothetical protein HOI71_24525, partial [Candidatus Poribacteria bacterium]|nr:hypothetical protein [Candidatus Poribacteria bacterium]
PHNMKASSSYPVEMLRDAEFTRENGRNPRSRCRLLPQHHRTRSRLVLQPGRAARSEGGDAAVP